MRSIRLTYDLADGSLVADSFANLTRGDAYLLVLLVVRKGAAELLPSADELKAAVKFRGENETLIQISTWSNAVVLGMPYTATMVMASDAMDEAFKDPNSADAELERIEPRFELEHGASGHHPTTAQKLPLIIENHFVRPGSILPPPVDPEDPWAGPDARYMQPGQNVSQLLNDAGYLTTLTVDIKEFSVSGAWTKPANAIYAQIFMFGGGGGGAGGALTDLAANNVYGGGGGGGAGYVQYIIDATQLGATESVVIGAGGAGGAARTVVAAAPNPGSSGGDSTFAGLTAVGGNGATSATGSGGAAKVGSVFIPSQTGPLATQAGATGNDTGNGGSAAVLSLLTQLVPTGGGGGGAVNGTSYNGGAGGNNSNNVSPNLNIAPLIGGGGAQGINTDGGDGVIPLNGVGRGGGGGSSSITGNGYKGGNGVRGGGGGGGGAAVEPYQSGAGGNGGDGYVLIITYCRA